MLYLWLRVTKSPWFYCMHEKSICYPASGLEEYVKTIQQDKLIYHLVRIQQQVE